MANVIKSSRATADMAGVWLQIADHNVSAADKVVDHLTHRFAQLAAHPESGERCDRVQVGLRQTTVEGYVVFYRIVSPDIEIVRVVHGARDLNSLFS